MSKKIEVLDALMGTGKTTAIINWMVANPHNKYLYVSPMLAEVEDGSCSMVYYYTTRKGDGK